MELAPMPLTPLGRGMRQLFRDQDGEQGLVKEEQHSTPPEAVEHEQRLTPILPRRLEDATPSEAAGATPLPSFETAAPAAASATMAAEAEAVAAATSAPDSLSKVTYPEFASKASKALGWRCSAAIAGGACCDLEGCAHACRKAHVESAMPVSDLEVAEDAETVEEEPYGVVDESEAVFFRVCGERVAVRANLARCQESLLATLIGSLTALPIARNAAGEIEVSSASSVTAFRVLAWYVTEVGERIPRNLLQELLRKSSSLDEVLGSLRLDVEYFLGSSQDVSDLNEFAEILRRGLLDAGLARGDLLGWHDTPDDCMLRELNWRPNLRSLRQIDPLSPQR